MFELETGLIFWTAVSFAVFVFIMVRYILPPFLKVLDERQSKIIDNIKNSDRDREKAADELDRAQKHLLAAQHQAEAMLQASHLEADREKRTLLEEARSEVKRLLNQSNREMENERLKAATAWRSQTAGLALAVASKILARTMTEQDRARLLDESLKEVEEALGR